MKKQESAERQYYFFIGTTAELIKLSPVIKEFKKRNLPYKIITSRQNPANFKELLSILGRQHVYHTFRIKPNTFVKRITSHSNVVINFGIWAIQIFFSMLFYFRKELNGVKKSQTFFIVHGDTVSALLGALVSKFFGVQLIHIESGLRSFKLFEPFPEELCRNAISYLSDIHFCPNAWSVRNLKNRKGVKINTMQNTLYESYLNARKIKTKSKYADIVENNNFFLLIIHRQEHLIHKKNDALFYIKTLTSYATSDLRCVFVLHRLTENFLKQHGLLDEIKKNSHVILTRRLPYLEFINVFSHAKFIATDGGSNQEEAYYMGKPCLILRNFTERIEGVGENALFCKRTKRNIKNFIQNYKKYEREPIKTSLNPSKIIVDYLISRKYID